MRRAETIALAALLVLAGCHEVELPRGSEPWPASAAETPLTHKDCVRMACGFGPARTQWQARFLAAKARAEAAGLLPNPTLHAEWEDFQILGRVPDTAVQQTYSLSFALGDWLTRSRRQEIAEHELQAELGDLLAERRRLAIEVCRAYDELAAARRTATLLRDAATAMTSQNAGMQKLADAGVEAPIAAAQAEAQSLDAGVAAAAAEREARALEVAFAFALGFARPVALQLAEPIDSAVPADDDLEELLAAAATTRPELQAALHRCEARLEAARLVSSPLRFVPVIGGGYRRLGNDQLAVGSLEFALPIFDTGAAAIAAADADLLAATAAAESAAQATAQEICSAVVARRAAANELRDVALPNAERRHALAAAARRWFEAGEIGFAELREPLQAVTEAERTVIAAELAVATASWSLRIDALLATLTPFQPERSDESPVDATPR